ncbi:MAG: NUDIX domain-containing protein [Candidatus Pacearchaeota archaeon]
MKFEQFSKQEINNLYSQISKGWNDRLAHVFRVYNLCKEFIKKYPRANKKILLTSALLHDIGHAREGEHSLNGSKMAIKILKNKDFTSEEILKISECIKTHSVRNEKTPLSIEGKILSDCDRLDVINIDTWLSVVNSKINKGTEIKKAFDECIEWEKEWLSLGTRFFTEYGKEKYIKTKNNKKIIINKTIKLNLKKIRRGVLIFLFNKSYDKILLVKRSKFEEWGVIAGKNEGGEDFIRTAVRELKEEVGLNRFLFYFIPSKISIKYNKKNKSLDILYNFCLIEKKGDHPKIKNKEEIDGLCWFDINRAPISAMRLKELHENLNYIRNQKFKN